MRLNASQPIVLGDGTMAPHFRDFLLQVANQIPIAGSGSPEGVVDAPLYSVYLDTVGEVQYRKLASSISGDTSKGWVAV